MIRRLITLGIALAVMAAIVWAMWPRPVPVETEAIGRRTIEVAVEEEGQGRIREVFTVSAPIAGQMLRIGLKEGDQVEANRTVVASIRPAAPALLDARARRIAEANAEAAAAAVDLAMAQLDQAQVQYDFLDGEFRRASELVRKGTISASAFDRAKLDWAAAKAAVESARAALTVKKRDKESAEAQLNPGGDQASDCCVDVKAPVSGRVLDVKTESEQVVQAGTPLVELGDPADLEIDADLLSRDAVRVKPGARATIEGWGGPPLEARVTMVSPAAFTKVSALGIEEQRVPVKLKLLGAPGTWKELGHGFRVVARILVWKGEGLIAVPTGALFRAGNDWAVFKVNDGAARRQVVEIGERNGEYAEVKGGLAEGDIVILHPSDRIDEGVKVED